MKTIPPLGLLRQVGQYLQAAPLKKRILGEGAWVVAGQTVSVLGAFVGMRLLTEFVQPGVFGVVSLLLGAVTLGSSMFCFPQLQAALRFYPDLASNGRVSQLRSTIGRTLRLTTGALVVLILGVGAFFGFASKVSVWAFVALAALLVSEVFRSFETNLLSAARRQKLYAIWTAAETCSRPLLAILVVCLLGATPHSVLLGYFLATAGFLLIFGRFAGRETTDDSNSAPAAPSLSKDIWHYALPLMPLAIVAWIVSISDRYVIGGLLSIASVGLYAAAYGLTSRFLGMPTSFLFLTLRPAYFQAVSENNSELAQKIVRSLLFVSIIASSLLVLIVLVASKSIVGLLLAPSYHSCWTPMPILAVAFAMMAISQVFNTVSLAYKNSKNVLVSESAAAITMIACVVPAVLLLGLLGAAMATCASYFVQLVVAYSLARVYLVAEKNERREVDWHAQASM